MSTECGELRQLELRHRLGEGGVFVLRGEVAGPRCTDTHGKRVLVV